MKSRTVLYTFAGALLTPALALASSGGEARGFSFKEHGLYIINFIIFMGILIYFAGPAIAKAIRERSESAARRLAESRSAFENAKLAAQVAREKMGTLEKAKCDIVKEMEEEGERLRATIDRRGQEEAEKIRASAAKALANERSRLEKTLLAEVALKALDGAEEQIRSRWSALPHDQYVRDFADATARAGGKGRLGA